MTRLFIVLTAILIAFPLYAADPPPVKREFRGVWVATVANIDWPSKRGLTAEEQKKELITLLDQFRKLNFNAIVLQVRPMCDSFYESKLEPWSEYLTGEQGKSPGYDPLKFAIKEAHKRGLELHAWFNPYRAWTPTAKSEPSPTHITKTRPDLAKKYGKHYWLNPTHPDTQNHSLDVIRDVVARYDLDGIHLDDYFYPYSELDEAKREIPFPDDDTWATYQHDGGKLVRDDWRRDAVNTFVKRMYTDTKKTKPWVKVGISPFGIWRPGHPAGIAGFDQYGKLYADAKLWFNEGWVDYLTPQLYWPIKQEKQSYPKLLAWWANENTKKRHLWPGNIPSRVGSAQNWPVTEITDQIEVTRKQPGAGGNVHFSAKPILRNTGGLQEAFAKVYAEPALVPATPWLSTAQPMKPTLRNAGDQRFNLLLSGDESTTLYAVQTLDGETWTTRIVPVSTKGIAFIDLGGKPPKQISVQAVNRFGIASEPATAWKD